MSYDDDIRLTPYTGSMPRAGADVPEYDDDDVDKLSGSPRVA
jgi:hypothetical protein